MRRLTQTLALALALSASGPDNEIAARRQAAQPRDAVLAAIAAAAGMPALENTDLPVGYRELRIRSEQRTVNLMPSPMLRLIEGPDEVTGTLWLFRTLSLRPGNPKPRDDEQCAPLGQQHICVRPSDLHSDSWTQVAIRLDQLGAWTLSDPCRATTTVTVIGDTITITGTGISSHSGLLSVERRVGTTVSAFTCHGPNFRHEGDGWMANEIYNYFLGLNGAIPPDPIRIAR